ncbi:bifunctional hydroxymethylpyrimidine kinase/phosphomethylpyrimidine kinase [Mucilaginibacter paludis]|uniref:hydroxymethylpyrimidine kinase n=1 Tax=Mucilaginibacter paludis DSM 18603 TaxID=714943 RepID=H1Y614_9SPHI|nr:bifunctional hydroxymethylpyrimidine kinase/phosphomethylpyrimidine kinase [Mucilaginibacter paludis]EHQ30973.1 phosphomethylpyrimidine kinase [Mucilaginibacter paludis DSM 18603]
MQTYKYSTVLTIAGSDSSGCAGIQADLKTFAALGCFGTSAITAVTAQNTLGVTAIHPIPSALVQSQMIAVIEDMRPSAIKIGMIPDLEQVEVIAAVLKLYKGIPIILDPVLRSSSGENLITGPAVEAMKKYLFPLVSLITPNIDEAFVFSGSVIKSLKGLRAVADQIARSNGVAVLLKGGHLTGAERYNVYADSTGQEQVYTYPYIASRNTRGTGCTLSSAIAAYLARGNSLTDAISLAGEYVNIAIKEGCNVRTGKGNGPLNHFFKPRKLARIESLKDQSYY